MRKFFVKSDKVSGKAPLYIQLKAKAIGHMKLNTRLEVDVEAYNSPNYYKTAAGKATLRTMTKVDEAITAALEAKGCTPESVRSAVYQITCRAAAEAENARLEEERRKAEAERQKEEEAKRDVMTVLDTLISEMESGDKKTKQGRNAAQGSLKNWLAFRLILARYRVDHPFTWEDVDESFGAKFMNCLEKCGYMPTYINKCIGLLKTLCRYAYNKKLHRNTDFMSVPKKAVTEADKVKEIYLTADEIQALYDMPLSGKREMCRDIFLIGCFTCQRFSDYSRIRPKNVTCEDGVKMMVFTQQKTRNKAFAPVMDARLETLLQKYGYNTPKVDKATIDKAIKSILKDLSADVPSLAEELETQLTMRERKAEERGEATFKRDEDGHVIKPRWAMVGTHTARRTGITLMYKTGLYDDVMMMNVSGHRDARTFRNYIKMSGEEIAKLMAERMKKQSSLNDK